MGSGIRTHDPGSGVYWTGLRDVATACMGSRIRRPEIWDPGIWWDLGNWRGGTRVRRIRGPRDLTWHTLRSGIHTSSPRATWHTRILLLEPRLCSTESTWYLGSLSRSHMAHSDSSPGAIWHPGCGLLNPHETWGSPSRSHMAHSDSSPGAIWHPGCALLSPHVSRMRPRDGSPGATWHTRIALREPCSTPGCLSQNHMGLGDSSPGATWNLRGQILETFVESEGWGGGPGAEVTGVAGG